jgi:hypothetical protein
LGARRRWILCTWILEGELVRDQLSVKEGRTAASNSMTKTILLKDRSVYFDDKDHLVGGVMMVFDLESARFVSIDL